jgi:pilus assembly protein CpaE
MTPTGLRRLAQVHRASPKTVIALTQGSTPISMTEATSCGASEVISYPASSIKLRNALHRIIATAEAVRGDRVVIREVPAPAPAAAAAVAAPAATGNAMVFTVTSPTGGCGKTFFATNLAAYLVGVTGGRVLLVDLDLQFGEVSLALGLRPQRTISELINEENLEEAFPEYLVDHSSGYKVLSAPADPFAAELVGPREATRVLELARQHFDYVVVDTPPSLNEVVLAAFDQSRYLIVMATLDVPSLRNLRVFLETIERLKLPAEDVSCVLNKAEPDNGIDLQELLRVYPRGFAAVLPYSKEVSRSLNVGQPVLMVDPKADISVKLLEAGAKLVPASEIHNPAWGGRPSSRVSWSGRRKERHSHTGPMPAAYPQPAGYAPGPQPTYVPAQPEPTHVAAAVSTEAPAAAEWPPFDAAPAPQAPPVEVRIPQPAFHQDAAPMLPPADVPTWASQQWTPPPATPKSPTAVMGATYQAATTVHKTSWLTRLFGRAGRHSTQSNVVPGGQPYRPQPSITTQMQVGPPMGATPGNPLGQANRSSGPFPEDGPSTLVFSGSRQQVPTPQPQGGRQRPTEAPNANRKEPRR